MAHKHYTIEELDFREDKLREGTALYLNSKMTLDEYNRWVDEWSTPLDLRRAGEIYYRGKREEERRVFFAKVKAGLVSFFAKIKSFF